MTPSQQYDTPKSLALLLRQAQFIAGVKRDTVIRHFEMTSEEYLAFENGTSSDTETYRQLMGYMTTISSCRYGVSQKKMKPYGLPHLDEWQRLKEGNGTFKEYAEVFTFLETCPTAAELFQQKPKENIIISTRASSYSGLTRKLAKINTSSFDNDFDLMKALRLQQEATPQITMSQSMKGKRETERKTWAKENYDRRDKIRVGLTPRKMRQVFLNAKKENKVNNEKLCIQTNTSIHAVQAIEDGSAFSVHLAARLLYFILTKQDIDRSEYKNKPKELFVDYLAGKRFRYKNETTVPTPPKVDNPKACNLPLFLKR